MNSSNLILCLTEWNFIQLHVSEWITVGRFALYVSYLSCQSSQKIGHKCKRDMCNQYYLWRGEGDKSKEGKKVAVRTPVIHIKSCHLCFSKACSTESVVLIYLLIIVILSCLKLSTIKDQD